MKKTNLFLLLVITQFHFLTAQSLLSKTNVTLYHDDDQTVYFDQTVAQGDSSAYDFIEHRHRNPMNWSDDLSEDIDMREYGGMNREGGFGGAQGFGFTNSPGMGSILKAGNQTTLYHKLEGINYEEVTDEQQLANLFNPSLGSNFGENVQQGDLFIGKLRGEERYVLIHITFSIFEEDQFSIYNSARFTFDYKYTAGVVTSITSTSQYKPTLYKSSNGYTTSFEQGIYSQFQLFNINGQLVHSGVLENNSSLNIDLSGFSNGVYLLHLTGANEKASLKIVK